MWTRTTITQECLKHLTQLNTKQNPAFPFKRDRSFFSRYRVDGAVDLQGAAAAPARPPGLFFSPAFSFLSRRPWHGSFCRRGSILCRSILLLHRAHSSVARSGNRLPRRCLSSESPNATEIPSTSLPNLKPFVSFSCILQL